MEDVPFMDSLQKKTTKQVGWMPTKQFEGKVKAGHVLVAVVDSSELIVDRNADERSSLSTINSQPSTPVGYLIGNDQYFKRDDVGIIYQINVLPEMRRSLVAASLLKAQFERSAYGCRLYCCWCAQDIEANRFWEAMGFVPLAYRAGSEKRGAKGGARVHIFWQKKIRGSDDAVNWWFPAKTDQGALREDRIVLPIPPGTHWSDAKPPVLTEAQPSQPLIEERTTGRTRGPRIKKEPAAPVSRKVHFVPPGATLPPVVDEKKDEPVEKPKVKRKKAKIDPKYIAAARELRDRYLEQVNEKGFRLESTGKYEVVRVTESTPKSKLLAA